MGAVSGGARGDTPRMKTQPVAPANERSSAAATRWLTFANLISLARLGIATPVSLYAVLGGRWPLAAAVFVAAVASDFADGIVARRRGNASALGGVFDHTADAVYVAATLWALAYAEAQSRVDVVPGILPLFIVLAFLQYLLDSRALAGQPLRTSKLGRINGIAYFVLAGVVLFRNALDLFWLPAEAIYWAALAILLSTLASMFDRLRALLKAQPEGG